MVINFPAECTKPGDRIAWCERAEEKLLKVKSTVEGWYKAGLTQAQYDQLPNRVKNRYSYVAQLSKADTKDFWENVYKPVVKTILKARNEEWAKAKVDTTYNPDLDGDIS